jgi:hypothetical protein
MPGTLEARRQARCDGRHTTVGSPCSEIPQLERDFALPRKAGKGRSRHGAPSPVPSSRCQTARFAACAAQHSSFRRRMSASRVLALPFLFCPFARRRYSARLTDAAAGLSPSPWRQRPARPLMRGGWSADRRTLSFCRACEARRPRFRGADLSRCDRDPSRRSTVAIFGRGPMVPPPAVGHRRRQRCVGAKPRRPGGRDPGPPGAAVSRRRRGTPLPAPPSGSFPETPLRSEDGNLYSIASRRSQ